MEPATTGVVFVFVAVPPPGVVSVLEAWKGVGMVIELLPTTTTPDGAKLTVSEWTTTGGPPGVKVTVPITKPVGLAVIVLDPTVITSGLVSVFVAVPMTTTPDVPSETGVLATVTAGPPGKMVCEPTTKPFGSAVILYVPIVSTSVFGLGAWGWPSLISVTGVTVCRGFNSARRVMGAGVMRVLSRGCRAARMREFCRAYTA